MAKKKELDITKTGPVGYKTLQDQNNSQFDEIDKFISESQNRILSVASQSDPYRDMRQMVQSPLANTNTAWGESMFDNKTANQADFENLGDVRAYNQPWYAQIGAGLAKGAVLAGTTFLDGTVGLLLGAGTAIKEDRWSGLWDNDFSKAMQSVNEWSEEVLPNYYTKAEQEQPWYENIFTANFLGDKFIKNLGFTIGAFYSGGLEAAGIRGLGKLAMAGAKRLGAGIKTLKNISNTSSIVAAGLGSATSAVNEGRIEALNNSKDWFELHKAQLDDIYSERIRALQDEYEANAGKQFVRSSNGENVSFADPAYTKLQQAIAREKEAYNQALSKLTEDRLKMGNADLLMNIPILTASNIIQFGKLYANGFKTARKAINVVGKPGEYKAGTTRLSAAYNITKGALSEGTEEILQGAASRISGNYYSTDVNNFYKSKTDPEAAQETLSWTKSFAEGINETVNDGSAWEEFFIGSLTGALGMPRFRGIRNAEGKLQSPITLEGGAINEWREYNAKIARENEVANYMNNRINSPEFKNYYQGLVRHNKYQNDMNRAAEEGNEFDFKNAEHAQLVSDIVMFDQAGKLEDLKSAINEASGTSQEDLESIVVNTTSKDENGDLIGPFSQYASIDDNGNIIANFGTEEDIDKMASKINKNKKDILDTIKKYQGIKDELILKTGQQLSDDQLEELTWMKSQVDDWTKRAVHMSADVKAAMSFILDNLNSFLRFNQQVRDFEGQSHAGLTDRYLQADKNVKAIEGAINTLNMVINQRDKVLAHTLATNPKFVDGLIKEINEIDETAFSADDKEDIITKLNDIIKLGNASKTYNAKLKEYLENPQKQVEDHARADEQAVQQEAKKKSDDLKASLNAAQNLQEFRDIIDDQDDIENRDRVLNELEDDGSEMAKNYRETSQYNNEVRRVLNESDAESQVKQDAMKLLQDQFSNSENLEQLANPNSIYINNENAFDEDSEGDVELSATRFQEAQYALQSAMSRVNNDNRFKDRFSKEYKKPVEVVRQTTEKDGVKTTKYGKRKGDKIISGTGLSINKDDIPASELESIEDMLSDMGDTAKFELLELREKDGKYAGTVRVNGLINGAPVIDNFEFIFDKNPDKLRGDDRITTGDSDTPTVPSTNGGSIPAATYTPPTGDVTASQVMEENKQLNEETEDSQPPVNEQDNRKYYYRSAIPELHIEASKYGDFRTFAEIAKTELGQFYYIRSKLNDKENNLVDAYIKGHPDEPKNVQLLRNALSPVLTGNKYLESLLSSPIPNFDVIYDYLVKNGAFTYLNEGNLKVGDEIGFMIDPSFNDHTIFIIDKRNGQVVGSLDESDYSVSRYEGLKSLIKKIRREYINTHKIIQKPLYYNSSVSQLKDKKSSWEYYSDSVNRVYSGIEYVTGLKYKSTIEPAIRLAIDSGVLSKKYIKYLDKTRKNAIEKEDLQEIIDEFKKLGINSPLELLDYVNQNSGKVNKFIATPTTRVSKVMVGRISYDNTEKSLKDIPNVLREDRTPIFGIIRNGALITNRDDIDSNKIVNLADMGQKEGRLYLLIPNGAGKYSPAAVRVKHFNNEEFNLNDSSVSSTPIGEDIKNAITKLSTATSQDDVSVAMQDLAQDLYMQDIMVTWFSSGTGNGVVISKKVRKPDGTYEKVTINGKEQIKEDKYDIYFSTSSKSAEIGGINFDAAALEDLGDTSALGTPKNPEDIYNEILGHLIKFNLPLQVSTGRINKDNGKFNYRYINSGILTSNITEASVKSTWFTIDYFDNEGNLHQAINPASVAPQPKRKVETPVGGTEGTISGTRIISVLSNKPYYVDLKTNTIRDDQGKTVEVTDSNRILFDLAWAQDNFGDSTNSSMMVDNKVLTPDGKVLDRSKQTYLSGQEAQDVKDTIAGRKKEREDRVAKSKEVISEIYENQKRVDKTRTDGEFYYVLEDDGEYHQYSRVHSRLGSNWVESDKQAKTLELARLNLSKFVDNPTQYENYLKYLENKFKVDLTAYRGKTDAKSRDTIVNIVRDKMSGTNSQRALDAGSAVDSIIRQYFTVKDVSKIVRPSNMSENAFVDLITTLNGVKSNMELMGERFLADNIVLFQKYPDGTRVAGEVDILSVDKDGNFRIYDVKTSRYSFYDFTDRYGHKVNYFTTPSATQRMSAKDYYTLQLSAYKNLFESQYGVQVTKLAVMPFVLSYDKENVSSVQSENGIPITYNPAVNVPLVSNVKIDKPVETPTTLAQAQTVLPIFETSLETQNPIEDLTPEHSMNNADERVGYFELGGKLHKGYLTPIAGITEIDVYITKVPNITKGFGRQGEVTHVGSNSFYAVFPNGKTFLFVKNNPVQKGMSDSQVEDFIRKTLLGNPQRMRDLASEKTILFDPNTVPIVSVTPITTVETPATINQGNTQTGAAYTAQKEQAINDHDEEFEDEFTLRKVKDTTETSVWNQEKELKWLNKVLPQLSEQDRVKVVKGLIKVSKRGTLAWGQFDKGIITLSDIAAEGTTYHEAFHVVFNLLLDQNERISLLNEYRSKHPNMDDLSLEEELAEDFREFVMQGGKDTRSLGRKIIDFFKSLFIKTKYWKDFRPSSIYYFRAINEGKYSGKDIPITTLNEARYKQEEYTQEMKDILAKAPRDSQGKLLAPNGKVSNLTEKQYAQVRTKAFKEWFGDWENDPANASKVVDENGEPLVVYHNDRVLYTNFSNKLNKDNTDRIYFSPFRNKWKNFSGNEEHIVFLNIKNPYYGNIEENNLKSFDNNDGLILELDNVIEEYIVSNPNQVKSATDNIGTFSTTNDDIRYRVVPNSSFEVLRAEEKEMLLNKGWTEEKFNSISQEERDYAVKCIAF